MPAPEPIPSRDRRAEEVVAALVARGDNVAAVRLVEAWTAGGTPTPRARMLEGRAFFNLRLMDRALVRAREAADALPNDPDALRLLAEVYLDRGWPTRARKPLDALQALGAPGAAELLARSREEPARPEANAREIEREGDPGKLLPLAETFLATGSFLRATGILERLRRTDPTNTRVQELLWGLAADFGSGGRSFESLLDELGPPATLRPVLAPVSLSDEPEHTENLRIAPPAADDDETGEEGRAFPTLFKGARARTPFDDDPGEVTQASRLLAASLAGGREPTDPDAFAESDHSGDTQILLVLKPGEKDKVAVDEAPRVVNLRDWRQAHATDEPTSSPELEDEDENVQLVNQGGAPLPEPAIPSFAGPIEVIEKHAIPDPSAFAEEAPTKIARRPDDPPPPPPAPPRAATGGLSTSGRAWLWVGAAAVLALFLILAVLALAHLRELTVSQNVRETLVERLATADPGEMTSYEERLTLSAAKDPAVAVALAELRLDIWLDVDGDPGRLHAAEQVAADLHGVDQHRAAMLRAALALAHDQADAAAAAMSGQLLQDDEERLLAARIDLARGDLPSALRAFDDLAAPDTNRVRIIRSHVAEAAGRHADAVAFVTHDRGGPLVAYARFLVDVAPLAPKERVDAADTFLKDHLTDPLPPRVVGGVRALQARAWAELGDRPAQRNAVAAGIARDGTNVYLTWLHAAETARAGNLLRSLDELDTSLRFRPGNADMHRAKALLLLDLDRRDELEKALADVAPRDRAVVDTIVRWEDHTDAPTAADEAELERMALQVRGSDDPFLQRFAPRFAAWQAQAGGAKAVEAWVKTLRDEGADDGPAHIALARWDLAHKNRVRAAQHIDRAAKLSPEYAAAWYWRGTFWQDAPMGAARARDAFHSYLALAPTGPRARAVADQVASR